MKYTVEIEDLEALKSAFSRAESFYHRSSNCFPSKEEEDASDCLFELQLLLDGLTPAEQEKE